MVRDFYCIFVADVYITASKISMNNLEKITQKHIYLPSTFT